MQQKHMSTGNLLNGKEQPCLITLKASPAESKGWRGKGPTHAHMHVQETTVNPSTAVTSFENEP